MTHRKVICNERCCNQCKDSLHYCFCCLATGCPPMIWCSLCCHRYVVHYLHCLSPSSCSDVSNEFSSPFWWCLGETSWYWLEGQVLVVKQNDVSLLASQNTKVFSWHITLPFLNAFHFLVTPDTAGWHWFGSFLLSGSVFVPSFISAHNCSAFMLHSGTTSALVTNIWACGTSNKQKHPLAPS